MKKFALVLIAIFIVLPQNINVWASETYQEKDTQSFSEYVPQHPQIYVNENDKEKIWDKIENYDWAKEAYENIRNGKWYNFYNIEFQSVQHYVDLHQEDPDWMRSRLAMYWKDGEHYTQTYVKDEKFDYGEGNAPVPTVRMPAMRKWNSYINPPLEDIIPFNETGEMLAIDRNNREAGLVKVPYEQTGHMVRYNNRDILSTVERASFLYWLTGEEEYAEFASSVVWTWILGTYYMKPPLDPEESLGGPGGYEPGGISGYYDYEVIHDDIARLAAVSYDFLYDYLVKNPDPHLKEIGVDVTDLFSTVFKRFIEIDLVRGSNTGNWNTNRFNCLLDLILVLETNDYYEDGKGREYYLEYLTTKATEYSSPIPDIMETYDKDTGLWPESPVYALGTVGQVLNWVVPLMKTGTDVVKDTPILEKAVDAIFTWMDPRGNMIVLGDGRGGTADVGVLEQMLSYYTLVGNDEKAGIIGASIKNAIDTGVYEDRGFSSIDRNWLQLATYVGELPEGESSANSVSTLDAYSEFHRHITMKNKNDITNGLMATLYGGRDGSHLNKQGLAIQLYGKGWALGVDSKAYESYWSDDFYYHSGPAGANTVVPGYTHGEIKVNAMEPVPALGEFTSRTQISDEFSFSDVTADEKRRLVSIVRTSPTTGYYVDIFRSDQNNNDYIYHNLGNKMEIQTASGENLDVKSVDGFGVTTYDNYNYFKNHKSVAYNGDFNAKWTISESANSPKIVMDMWMSGQEGRTIYQVDAPPTTYLSNVSPNQVNSAPQTTPTLIVRQTDNNALSAPFVSVFEPYEGDNKSIDSITDLSSEGNFVGMLVESKPLNDDLAGRKDYIVSSSDNATYKPLDDMVFTGMYGIASETDQGFNSLYLGSGKLLQKGSYKIESTNGNNVAAGIELKGGKLYYSADREVNVTIPFANTEEVEDYAKLRIYYTNSDGKIVEASDSADSKNEIVTATLPSGYDSEIFVAESLKFIVDEAESIDNEYSIYTKDSYEALQLAIEKAKSDIGSKEELNEMMAALKLAIKGLKPDYKNLSSLVEQFIKENGTPGSKGIINALSQKLTKAQQSEKRGNMKARNNQINTFVNQVNAQRGKALTDEQADILLSWDRQ